MGTVEEAFPFPPYCGDVNWLGEMGIQVQHTRVFSSGLIFSTLTLTVVLFSLFPRVSEYYGGLAHAIMEAKKSHDLLSARRPRKASDIILSESEGLRTRGAKDVSPSPKAPEPRALMSCSSPNREQISPPSAFLFYLGPYRLDDAHPHWLFFTKSIDTNANLFQEHPHRHTLT